MMGLSRIPRVFWLPVLLSFYSCVEEVDAFSPSPRSSHLTSSLQASDLSSPPASSSSGNGEKEYSFFDEASIYVRAGSGGQGASTYKKAKKGQNGIPDGGSGGMGGSVYLEVDDTGSLNTLARFHGSRTAINDNNSQGKSLGRLISFRAKTGLPGGRMYDNGRKGEDCIVKVPPGTVVCIERGEDEQGEDDEDILHDEQGLEMYESDDHLIEIGTLTIDNPRLLVAKGGSGGEGTGTLKGKPNGATRRGPVGGERYRLRLTLKIVADVALVGKPNAGKSTFLAAVTRAQPKIANYPFTTVVPNLGVWIPEEFQQQKQHDSGEKAAGSAGVILCDVPGLIAGAADGVGLGHAFLRHVERCRAILHLVDGTSDDPVADYKMVQEEIRRYGSGSLADKPQVVVVNKIDAWEQEGEDAFEKRKQDLQAKLKAATGHTRIMWVSAKERQNMDELMKRMATYISKIKDDDEA